jgi:hypothetical protein
MALAWPLEILRSITQGGMPGGAPGAVPADPAAPIQGGGGTAALPGGGGMASLGGQNAVAAMIAAQRGQAPVPGLPVIAPRAAAPRSAPASMEQVAATAPATDQAPDHSTRDRWLALLAGGPRGLFGEIQQQDMTKRYAAAIQAQQQMLQTRADQLGLTGRERVLFLQDPTSWAAATKTRFEAATVGPGSRRGILGDETSMDVPAENKVVGKTLVTPDGKVLYAEPEPAKLQGFPVTDKVYQVGGGGGAPAAGEAQHGGFDAIYGGFTKPHEGGYTAEDGNGAPANYGINQKANPDVGDVSKLTPERAKALYHDRYWLPSGADSLAPPLQAIHFDTAVNMGVGTANDMLRQAGGDPQKYLELRDQRFRAIAKADPSKRASLPTWLQRNQDLAQFAGRMAAQPSSDGGVKVIQEGTDPNAPPGGALYGSDSGPQGEDFLKTLPSGYAQQVKATASGDLAMPSSFVMKTPYGQKLMADIMQFDPTATAVNLPARVATRKDFTSGKSAANITAMNTLIGHLDTLDRSIADLGNTSIGLVNKPWNWVAEQVDPNFQKSLARFSSAKTAVANELVRVWRGTGGARADVEDYLKQIDDAKSPAALHETVRTLADLLSSRLESVGQQYSQGMGRVADPFSLLSPDKAAVLKRMGGDPIEEVGGAAKRPAPAAPSAPAPRGGSQQIRTRSGAVVTVTPVG